MPTDAQQQALTALHKNGGEGVIDKHGKLVARGERLMGIEPITRLRLVTTGHVEVRGPLRLALTALGEREAAPPALKVNPHSIHGSRHQAPARQPGAE